MESKEPSPASNTAKSFCLLGGEFLWVLIESQEPRCDSSHIIGKSILFGVVPIEFLSLNSFVYKNVKHSVESS